MNLEEFKTSINTHPEGMEFSEIISLIENVYVYTPTTFYNGIGKHELKNDAGTNEGSCKIFAFAKELALSEPQTLHCFGHYYRDDVLKNPSGTDHANIRNFMEYGWKGIRFESDVLTQKGS